MSNFWGHFKTITTHKLRVMKYCFRAGLYKQGLLHDLSKYTPVEFLPGVKYYQGNRSPNEMERLEKGYSSAWLHHKGRNRHHLEYWIDYAPELGYKMGGMEMPVNYVVEMFCDRIAACQIAPYPPGVPVIAPGELIEKKHLAYLREIGYNKRYCDIIQPREEWNHEAHHRYHQL